MKNYYDLLGVDKNASQKQIDDAFKRLSLKFHPDKNGGDPYYVELFQVINEARQVLSDETKRLRYDYSLKRTFSGRNFYTVTDEFLQRKKNSAAKEFSKQDFKKAKWPLSVAGFGFVITLILILADKGIEYFSRSIDEKAALNIKVLKRDSLYDNSPVTDVAKNSPQPFTPDIAASTDSAEKISGTINQPLKVPAEKNPLSSNNKQKAAPEKKSVTINQPLKIPAETLISTHNKQKAVAEKKSATINQPLKIPAETPLSSNNKQKAAAEKKSGTINQPLKVPVETPLSTHNKQKAAPEKRSGTINQPLKVPAKTPLSSNNRQKAAPEKSVVALVKPAKKENQVTKPSSLSESVGRKKTTGAYSFKALAAADTKVANNILLSTSQMTNILNGILSRKAEAGSTINCVKVLVTNSSNVINAFKVANFLRANGFIIAGRETIKGKSEGIKIHVYKKCINVVIGNL